MSQPPPPPPVMPPILMQQDGQPPDMAPGSYYPQEPSDHLTGGLPINLDSLRDGPPGSKPFYPYSTLIRYAIKGSPHQKLLLEDIYYAIESRFPYFRTAPNGWKNSVRHNLSLNPCFEKVPRPLTDRGKGSYWTVNDNVDPRTGVHRIRKKKPKGAKRNSEEADVDYHPPDAPYDDAQFVQHPDDAGGPTREMETFQHTGYEQPPNMAVLAMPGIPYPRPIVPYPTPKMALDEGVGLDEHGQINWRMAWLKELGHLQQVTAEQEKAQVEQEWYHMMLYRLRAAFGTPNPGEHMPPPHGMLPPQPNPEDIQQQQQ